MFFFLKCVLIRGFQYHESDAAPEEQLDASEDPVAL